MPMPMPVLVVVIVVIAGFVIVVVVVLVIAVHGSFRHRCRCVVVFADHRDVHSSDRPHPSPPNLFGADLEFVRQCGHAHGQAGCHMLDQVVGIAGGIQTGRQEHIARGSRKAVEMGMVTVVVIGILFPVCNGSSTGSCCYSCCICRSNVGIIRRCFGRRHQITILLLLLLFEWTINPSAKQNGWTGRSFLLPRKILVRAMNSSAKQSIFPPND